MPTGQNSTLGYGRPLDIFLRRLSTLTPGFFEQELTSGEAVFSLALNLVILVAKET
jgi:hypothetical protein